MAKIIRLTAKNGAIKEIPFVGKFKLDPQFVGAKVEVIDSFTGALVSAVKVRIRGKNVDLSYSQDAQPEEAKPEVAAESQSSSDVGSKDGSKSSDLDTGDVGASAQQPSAALPAGGGGLGAAGISGTSIALGVVGLGALAGIVAASGGSDKATTPTPPPPPSTTPPPAPTGLDLASADDSGASSTDNLTSQTSALTIIGQAEANARVELFDGTTSLGTTTANASGAFSLDVTLAAGERSITAKATNAAGNVGAASAALVITVDATAPAAPTGLDLAAADDTGSSNSDDVTSQASALTITGQAHANARIELFDGTTSLGTTTANASGAFSLDVTLAASATPHAITAKATDAAGNVSAASAALAITVDATAPAAPTGLDLAAADDSGSDNADNITNQTSALTITGQAEANARIELFDGTTSLGTTTASDSGAFSFDVTLAAGARSITAKATDAAGNVSAASAVLAVTVDATARNVSGQIVAGPVTDGNGLSVDIYLANGTLLVSGVPVNADGSFTATNLPIVAGDVIFARVVDSTTGADYLDEATGVATDVNAVLLAAKVVEGTSVTMNINPLTTIAAIKAGLAADGSGTIANAAAATNANTATAQAFGLSGIDITTTSVVATNSGGYNSADGLSSGEKVGAVLAALSGLDSLNAGNSQTTITSLSQLVTVDGNKGQLTGEGQVSLMRGATATEDKVEGSLQTLISDSVAASSPVTQVTINTIATDNIITANEVANLTLSGTVSSGVTGVSLLLGSRTAAATVNGSAWSYTLSADDVAALGGDGAKVIQAQAALPDAASATASRLVTLKIVPPTAPTGLDLAAADDSGSDNADNVTNQPSGLTITGQAEANARVELFDGTTSLGTTTANASGAFSLDVTLAAGARSITAKAIDAAGNVSAASAALAVTVDATAPAKPTGLDLASADDSGSNNADNVTNQTSALTITGQTDPNARVQLFNGATSLGFATASDTGAFSFEATLAASATPHAITATAIDAAGNLSAASDVLAVTTDTIASSTTATIAAVTDNVGSITGTVAANGTTDDNILVLSGTLSVALVSGERLAVYDGSSFLGDATVTGTGWSFAAVGLTNRSYSFTVRVIDAAGNTGTSSAVYAITVDTAAPAAPTGLDLAAEDDSGSDISDNITSQTSGLTITGQAEANASVELFDGTTSLGTTTASNSGAFSFQVTLAAGAHSITAKATDAAGNVGEASATPLAITVDATAPAAPTGPDLFAAIELSAIASGTGGFVINGASVFDNSGRSVSSAGDVNGDGYDDLIVGASSADSNGTSDAGASYVVFGKKDNTDPVNLSDIANGIGGFVINGASVFDNSGISVSSAGDVNNDGYNDLIVGARQADPNGSNSGASYVVFGKADGTAVDVRALGTGGFVINGASAGDYSGRSVSSAGDVNGDGYDDLIVGADYADPNGNYSGASYVVFGKANNTAVSLSTIASGTGGFVINGAAEGDYSGFSVRSAGDVNGDGLADLIVGAKDAGPNGFESGASYVVFGKAAGTAVELSAIASGTGGFVINGASRFDNSGISVSSAGDVNNDGFDDLIVGAFGADPNGDNSGASYVVFGKTNTNAVDLSALGTGGFVINGASADDFSGNAVSSAGDVNKDGFDDLIVGAYFADPNGESSGASYVVFGKATSTAVDLSAIAGGTSNLGFVINGAAADDRSGSSVSSAGDVNGDGYVDLIVGAYLADPNGTYDAGASYVVFGGPPRLDLAAADDTGLSDIDNLTSQSSGLTITGQAEANARVELFDGTTSLGTTTANASGAFSLDVTLAAGARSITAKAIDAAGNVSAASAALAVTVDTTAPAAPTSLDLADADDTGSRNSDNITSQSSGLTITGQADANARIELFDGTTSLGTTTANASGAFSLDVTLAAGARSITAKAIDAAGNGSAASSIWVITVDTTAPAAPTGPVLVVPAIELSALGSSGFVINGASANDKSGISVSSAGDVNGDGYDDLIVGAFGADPSGKQNAGASYVVFGKQVNPASVNLSDIASGTGGFVINGASAGDYSGYSVSSAGDVNGDGFDDIIVGAFRADPNGNYSGASYVVFGKRDNTTPVNLSSLGSGGFVINGAAADDRSGRSVSSAGDVNGDGFDDIIVGAFRADPNGKGDSGASYVVFGKRDNTTPVNLSSLGSGGFVINGASAGDGSGYSVSSAGDVNGDGIDDLIVGARYASPNGTFMEGVSYVVFGKANNTDPVNLSALGSSGFVINGAASGGSGVSVSSAGDVNNDGYDDLIVGADRASASYVVFGKASNTDPVNLSSLGTGGFVINGAANDNWGVSVSSAGDVNNDGYDDLIVGADRASPNGNVSGASYVVFGKANNTAVDLSAIGSGGFVINGASAYDRSGFSVSSAGDVNGDGFDDLIVGAFGAAPNGTTNAGASYVVFGANFAAVALTALDLAAADDSGSNNADNVTIQTSGLTISGRAEANARIELFNGTTSLGFETASDTGVFSFEATLAVGTHAITAKAIDAAGNVSAASPALNISVFDPIAPVELSEIASGNGGFVINGAWSYDYSGRSVSSAGDVNGDGFDDMIVGAYTANQGYGASYVVFGKADGTQVDLRTLGADGFVINAAGREQLGFSVSSAGDVNNDGFDDLIVGARFGPSYVVFGKAEGTAVEFSDIADGTAGFVINSASATNGSDITVSSAGDVNGDGFDDLIVGAFRAGPNFSQSGASYVVYGKAGGTAVELSDIANGTGGFVINGASAGDYSGRSVSSAGDVNGDGYDDLIVGADRVNQDSGASYVVFGKAEEGAVVNLSALGTGGFVINGTSAGDYSGRSVSSAGDVNGDGLDDLIVGAHRADPNGDRSGASYVVFGKANNTAVSLSTIASGTGGFVINGAAEGDYSGFSVRSAGDVNGDGLADLIVGAKDAGPNGFESGASYVVFGKAAGTAVELSAIASGTGGFVINGASRFDNSGISVSSAGDVNNDGFDDLIVGAFGADPNGDNSGASYVVYGGNFTGAVTQVGTSGNDALSGTIGNDVIFGGLGDDIITTNGGNDRIAGGPGADTFVISDVAGTIRILDFGQGDTLDLSAFGLTSRPAFTQIGYTDTRIQLDTDTFVIVEGYLPTQLTDLLVSPSSASIVL